MPRIHLSIATKTFLVLGLTLLFAMGMYTLLASSLFREEKTALLFDLNNSVAVNLATQLRSEIVETGEQLKTFALGKIFSAAQGAEADADWLRRSRATHVIILRKEGMNYERLKFRSPLPSFEFDPAINLAALNGAEAASYSLWRNKRSPEELFFAASLDVKGAVGHGTYIAVAKLDPYRFFRQLRLGNLFESHVVGKDGASLFSASRARLITPSNLSDHPLVSKVKNSGDASSSGLESYEYDGSKWFGAYAPVGVGDLFVVSQANDSLLRGAILMLLKRSGRFAIIVLMISFFVSVGLVHRLTGNLRLLTRKVKEIGRGDLDVRVSVESSDEIKELADSINWMANEIQLSQEEIRRHNRELEQKVAERTKELREKNIALKAAQEAQLQTAQMAAVGEIAGRTAHEILNPLTGIISKAEKFSRTLRTDDDASTSHQLTAILKAWSEEIEKGGVNGFVQALQVPSTVKEGATLLEEDLENLQKLSELVGTEQSPVEEAFNFIHQRGMRIIRIVDQMRRLTRSSSLRQATSCHEAVGEAVNTTTDYAEKQGIALELVLEADEDVAVLNRDELIQILSNLIRNSIQAISASRPAGSKQRGKIRILTTNDGDHLVVGVIDNGPGVPPEKVGLLFNQGFTTKSPDEGTGLGLSICRRYARAFGGDVVFAYSEPKSKGTCFEIRIPLGNQAAAEATPKRQAAAA